MSKDHSLHQRRRPPSSQELEGIPWLNLLTPAEREKAIGHIVVGDAVSGEIICRVGRAPTYWFGVVDGLLKMSIDTDKGDSLTFTMLLVAAAALLGLALAG